MEKGYFLVLEGIDGSGTTTISNMLAEYISSVLGFKKVMITREPSDSPYGVAIRKMIDSGTLPSSKEQILFFANDRYYHWENEIKPFLEDGWIVISDRYVMSSMAYQGVLITKEDGFNRTGDDEDDVEYWNEFMKNVQLVKNANCMCGVPDKTYFLRVGVGTAQGRQDSRDEKSSFDKYLTFQHDLVSAYNELAEYADADIEGSRKTLIDVVNEYSAEKALFGIIGDLMVEPDFKEVMDGYLVKIFKGMKDSSFVHKTNKGIISDAVKVLSDVIQEKKGDEND